MWEYIKNSWELKMNLIKDFYKFNKSFSSFLKSLFGYWFISLLIPMPWFIFSFINTGNPFYPFFSNIYKVGLNFQPINPFIHRSDSISVVYILIPVVILFVFRKLKLEFKIIFLYSLLALIIWYLTPKTDGGRFILSYLPAFSLLFVLCLNLLENRLLKKIILAIIICVSFFSIVYRGIANYKYLPVIFGKETKTEFLTKHLNFKFGDFYDTDNYFKNRIKKTDRIKLSTNTFLNFNTFFFIKNIFYFFYINLSYHHF